VLELAARTQRDFDSRFVVPADVRVHHSSELLDVSELPLVGAEQLTFQPPKQTFGEAEIVAGRSFEERGRGGVSGDAVKCPREAPYLISFQGAIGGDRPKAKESASMWDERCIFISARSTPRERTP
jgi:hypothetical protein